MSDMVQLSVEAPDFDMGGMNLQIGLFAGYHPNLALPHQWTVCSTFSPSIIIW